MKFFEEKSRYEISKEAEETSVQQMDRIMEPYKRFATAVVLIGFAVLYIIDKTPDSSEATPVSEKDVTTTLLIQNSDFPNATKKLEYFPIIQNEDIVSADTIGPVFPEK